MFLCTMAKCRGVGCTRANELILLVGGVGASRRNAIVPVTPQPYRADKRRTKQDHTNRNGRNSTMITGRIHDGPVQIVGLHYIRRNTHEKRKDLRQKADRVLRRAISDSMAARVCRSSPSW